jgi:hypothetical protein
VLGRAGGRGAEWVPRRHPRVSYAGVGVPAPSARSCCATRPAPTRPLRRGVRGRGGGTVPVHSGSHSRAGHRREPARPRSVEPPLPPPAPPRPADRLRSSERAREPARGDVAPARVGSRALVPTPRGLRVRGRPRRRRPDPAARPVPAFVRGATVVHPGATRVAERLPATQWAALVQASGWPAARSS